MGKYSGSSGGDENLIINLTVSGKEAAEKEVKSFINALNTMLKGAGKYNINEYFDSLKSSIGAVKDSLRTFLLDFNNADRAADFLKSYNSYIAQFDGSITDAASHIKNEFGQDFARRVGMTFESIVSAAENAAPAIARVFDPQQLRDSFSSFTYLIKELGLDVSKLFDAAASGDSSSLRERIDELTGSLEEARWRIAELENEIERLGDSAANKKLEQFKRTAFTMAREFKSLLSANGVGAEDMPRFTSYITQIQEGTLTVRDAFAQAKKEFGHLFSTPIGNTGLEDALARIEEKVNSLSGVGGGTNVLAGLEENADTGTDAIKRETIALEEMNGKAAGLEALIEALKAIAENMKESGDSSAAAFESINRLVESIQKLGDVDETKLERIATIMSSLGGAGEIRAGTTSTDNLIRLVSSIDSIGNGSGINTLRGLASIDFTRLSALKVSKAALSNLATYLPEIQGIDVSPLERLANINWTNLEGLKLTKTNLQNVTSLVKDAGLQAAQGAFKFDETSLSSLSQTIQDAIQKATANIKLTIDNVELSAKAQQTIADKVSSTAASGAKANTGVAKGGQTDEIREEENELNNLIKLYEQYYDLRSKEAQAINKNVEANADIYNSRARAIWEEIAAIEAEKPELAELAGSHDRVTAAVRNSQTAVNSADAAEVIAQAKNQEHALDSLVAKYQEYYSLRSKQITATHAGNIDNADLFRARAQALWDEIGAIEEAVPELARLAAEHQKVTAALQRYQETANKGQAISDSKIATEEAKKQKAALDDLVNKYQQYYDLRAKQISAVHSGNTDNVDMYRDEAQAILEQIHTIEEANPALAQLAAEQDKVTAAYRKYRDTVNKGQATSDSVMADRIERDRLALERYQKQLESMSLGSTSIKFSMDATMSDSYTKAWLDVKAAIVDAEKAGDTEKASAIENVQAKIAALEKMRDAYNREATDIGKLQSRLDKLGFSSPKTTFGGNAESVERYTRALQEAQAKIDAIKGTTGAARIAAINAAEDAITSVQNLNKELNKQETVIAKHKTLWESLADGWRRFGGWSIVTRSFTKIISIMRDTVNAVKEVDAAMTELKKVTDLTQKGYNEFFTEAQTIATSVGSKLSDVVRAAGDFARLGFGIEDATALAKAATLYMNIGDGIESINEASESLISTMKAFKIEAADAMSIVDMFNEVGKELLPMPVVTRCLAECYIGQSSIALCA